MSTEPRSDVGSGGRWESGRENPANLYVQTIPADVR